MPETRSNALITIKDADRSIDLRLSVDFDWLAEGAVEHPTVVDIEEGTIWFGDYAFELVALADSPAADRSIKRHIEEKYAAEIVEAIHEQRASLANSAN